MPLDLEVVGTRVFDAPRELVFRAYNDPALVPRWWGPRSETLVVEEMDVRMGGGWRYRMKDATGNEFAFFGEYREIVPPSRIARTFNYEPIGPGHETLETVELEELDDGRTRMISTQRFLTVEDRDGMIQSGMESGYSESLQRLDELLEELKAAG
ncbi:MAG: SRPBCC family protein [Candidatus Dormibacteraeota bacterium]|uniref:ATPase n=2 Tax=Candidatus Aeolococcus gillhamiae TaxID=3127015 RepID=A0A2W5ZFR2_9BACT|nr:SRPBCC family protein [Candidatus Dormibacteraeota bacterium]PZR81845.1 MAG: ATPase [Candidatus Dormibacter sp. RRmetagenome_bin12]